MNVHELLLCSVGGMVLLDVRQIPAEGPLGEAVARGMNISAEVLGAASLEGLELLM